MTVTARQAGLVGCRTCGLVSRPGIERCPRCGAGLESRERGSLQRVWAWLVAGLLAFVPANLYPMLITSQLYKSVENTIAGGIVELAGHGSYFVAFIIFVASILIPVGKFAAIAYLALVLSRPHRADPHRLLNILAAVEWIGRWSMIDVFVVAILTSLVQFDVVASIKPGIAAVCFALSVVFTMLAAQSFDPRMVWDRIHGGQHG